MEVSSHFNPDKPDLLLVNPAAGGGRAKEALPALREFARQRGWQVEICVTQNPADLAARARRAAESGRKRILVLGGDGTFQVLVNSLRNYPETVLGVIPAGGGNDLAAALGLPQEAIPAAELLLASNAVRQLDAVRVRTANGDEHIYMGGGGVGLDAEAVRYASGPYRNLRGRLRYVLAALHALSGYHAIQVRLQIQGIASQDLESTALLVGVLNTPSYGGGLYLAPAARTDDGMLDLVLLDDLGVIDILRLLPALALRGALKTKKVRRFLVERVHIETKAPARFHGDGELLAMTPVEISVLPRAVRVLCPARKVVR